MKPTLTLLLFFCFQMLNAQVHTCIPTFIGQDPVELAKHELLEQAYQNHQYQASANLLPPEYTIPVVVHIIHNNGDENISDAMVQQGIEWINESFANSGYYDGGVGFETPFALCLAQRDPDNNATNGITRTVSTLTNLTAETQDVEMKDLTRWDPTRYLNIWLVKEVTSQAQGPSVAGYAYFPSSHGNEKDGIVGEARWFGSTQGNTTVYTHEFGHYLGLFHTFDGACSNDDCLVDGDKVCDTPPDQSTAYTPCATSVNSCSSDVNAADPNNPFTTDQDDATWNYMDYGNIDCFKGFSEGQSNRMEFFLNEARASLLTSLGCAEPCETPISADFSTTSTAFTAGDNIAITNTSTNANAYEWLLNDEAFSTLENPNLVLNTQGDYTITLIASNDDLCYPDTTLLSIYINCPVEAIAIADDAEVEIGENVFFENMSNNGSSYEWYLDGAYEASTFHWAHTFDEPGDFEVSFVATNGICFDTATVFISVFPECTLGVTPSLVEFSQNGRFRALESLPDGSVIALEGDEVVKLDNELGIVWSKRYDQLGANSSFAFKRIVVAPDGGFLIVGQNFDDVYGLVIKLSSNGDYEWSYNIDDVLEVNALTMGEDGMLYLTGKYDSYGVDFSDMNITKINGITGELIWMKRYDDGLQKLIPKSMVFHEGNVYVSGYSRRGYLIMKVNSSGDVIWSKVLEYNDSTVSTPPHDMVVNTEGNLVFNGNTIFSNSSWNQQVATLFELDTDGNIVRDKLFLYEEFAFIAPFLEDIQLTTDGNYLLTFSRTQNILKVDPDFNIIWSRKYLQEDGFHYALPIVGGDFYVTGNVQTMPWYIRRISENDEAGDCGFEPSNWYLFDDELEEINMDLVVTDIDDYTPRNFSVADFFLSRNIVCTTLTVGGMDAELSIPSATLCDENVNVLTQICNTGTAVLTADVPITFYTADPTIDNTAMALSTVAVGVNINPEDCQSINFEIPNPNLATIFAVINDDASLAPIFDLNEDFPVTSTEECEYFDNIASSPILSIALEPLDLGPDLGLCDTDIVALEAGMGQAFVWQDGSTDNSILVENAGIYWVERVNLCGLVESDTVIVSAYEAPILDLGEDIVRCANGVATLTANAEYEAYEWFDGAQFPSYTTFNDGNYWLTVTDECGNTQSDTVAIITDAATAIDLGADTMLCPEETLFYEFTGFDTYEWTPTFGVDCPTCAMTTVSPIVNTTYYFVATTDAGCISSDSIFVQRLKPEECLDNTIDITNAESFIKLYPNPSLGDVQLTITLDTKEKVELQMYNTIGQKMYEKAFEASEIDTKLDLAHLIQGTYMVKISIANQQYVQKLILLE